MKQTEKKQMSETFLLGALLTLAGGYLDAYTFIARGGVFANAQTGNVVFFGMHLAQGEWLAALAYVIPILAFVAGIFISEAIRGKYRDNRRLHWRQITVAIEMAVLFAVSFLPQGRADAAANVLVSFVCAMQVESFRRMNGSVFVTTMCTGNLRSATEHLFLAKKTGSREALSKSLQYYGLILFFVLGVVAGTFVTREFGVRAVLFSLLFLGTAFVTMFLKLED